jgi:hypothetical protein
VKIEIGREYNIQSLHRSKDDNNYIFRGVVVEHLIENKYKIRITEFNVSKGNRPGNVITITDDRFKSLVARTNLEAKSMLSKEW